MHEYQLLMKAKGLQQLDKERDLHLQAFLNREVKATKKQGKQQVYVYPKFEDFFDYEKREKERLKKINNEPDEPLSNVERLMFEANK